MRSPSAESFSLFPILAVHQAMTVECAPFWIGREQMPLLVLARYAQIPSPDGYPSNNAGESAGVEIVAYHCDDEGRVFDWERRYETSGIEVTAAMSRLRYSLANGLLSLCNYEGQIAAFEEAFNAAMMAIDWEAMPKELQ